MAKYIHQLDQWPEYRYDTSALLSGLETINSRRGILFGMLEAIGFQDVQQQNVEALTHELVNSSAIEGESLDLETVRNSVALRLGLELDTKTASDHYIDGLVEMTLDATRNCDKPLTAERIFNWHSALFPTGRNVFGRLKMGDWRDDANGPMVVVSKTHGREVVHFEAPAAKKLPEEMEKFVTWVEAQNETSAILKAGIAHVWFETIHPLDDGNGRIGRNIMDLLLARADSKKHHPYSLASQINKRKSEYYNVLEATQKGNLDYTEWLSWYLIIFADALDSAIKAVSRAISRTKFWQSIQDVQLNERQRKAISQMLMGWEGRMTNKKYSKFCKCSDATATRDLSDLVEKGILRTDGPGGRSVGYEIVFKPE